ncbi:MAG: TetR/AcrR family transcriptional regulator [Oscillospiraceae bacterium]|nr:TetR/AcrR family transcriptional regulator [Oscillospiraceae bacterium]
MPKQRITKKMVVDAAFELAKSGGMEQVTVKTIAEKIGCSVQPIYSYCKNMDGLKQDVTNRVKNFIKEYVASQIDMNDPFRSTGRAYIQLTKEEPHLFKIFILHRRDGISSLDDLYRTETDEKIPSFIADNLNISTEKAKQLHLDMLIYTIGIGTIFSVTTPGIPTDEIFAQQERVYQIFMKNIMEVNHEQ